MRCCQQAGPAPGPTLAWLPQGAAQARAAAIVPFPTLSRCAGTPRRPLGRVRRQRLRSTSGYRMQFPPRPGPRPRSDRRIAGAQGCPRLPNRVGIARSDCRRIIPVRAVAVERNETCDCHGWRGSRRLTLPSPKADRRNQQQKTTGCRYQNVFAPIDPDVARVPWRRMMCVAQFHRFLEGRGTACCVG